MNHIDDILHAMNEEVYQRFRQAVTLGRWSNGEKLTDRQRQTCIQAIIVYENANLPETERTGYVPPKTQPCEDQSHIHTEEKPLSWK